MSVKIQDNGKPWRYTDDLIAGAIIAAYISGKALGTFEVPDEMVTLVLGWVFGKRV